MTVYKFWMIYGGNLGEPKKIHHKRDLAILELQRLARQHQGKPFYLMEAMEVYCSEAIPVKAERIIKCAPDLESEL